MGAPINFERVRKVPSSNGNSTSKGTWVRSDMCCCICIYLLLVCSVNLWFNVKCIFQIVIVAMPHVGAWKPVYIWEGVLSLYTIFANPHNLIKIREENSIPPWILHDVRVAPRCLRPQKMGFLFNSNTQIPHKLYMTINILFRCGVNWRYNFLQRLIFTMGHSGYLHETKFL